MKERYRRDFLYYGIVGSVAICGCGMGMECDREQNLIGSECCRSGSYHSGSYHSGSCHSGSCHWE